MQTTVTKRGQTVIPAAIRKRYHITGQERLAWLDDGETIRVVPVPVDAVASLRGRGRGKKLVDQLLKERSDDLAREDHT